ncbi:MAG: tRNA preQ1(34) S-adenosylmethionine ribosyltransferase-isomerase QueA [Candidatus Sulfotelmatobacter sp.]
MLVSDFDFQLPDELIAQEPLAARDASRMLCVDCGSGQWSDSLFRDFPERLRSGDLLVFNNTRVFPARLYGLRKGTCAQPLSPQNPAARDFLHGRIEVLLTRQLSHEPNDWECLVRPGRKIGLGEQLFFGQHDSSEHDSNEHAVLQAEVIARGEFGERRIRFQPVENFFLILDRIGHVPLPPYIAREDSSRDRERYQTVYAAPPGSVAAPTAGLHFTAGVLDRIRCRGIETAEITLHVGLGTFQPVRVEQVEDHKIHSEPYSISSDAACAITRALTERRRIIGIGTTTVRTLEHAVRAGAGSILPGSGMADIFIYPGFEFKVVRAMLTNFHLPQSSLLMLVSAFAGKEQILRAYEHAVGEKYRFYSYGDCMFIE